MTAKDLLRKAVVSFPISFTTVIHHYEADTGIPKAARRARGVVRLWQALEKTYSMEPGSLGKA